jgi:hypothetical protein
VTIQAFFQRRKIRVIVLRSKFWDDLECGAESLVSDSLMDSAYLLCKSPFGVCIVISIALSMKALLVLFYSMTRHAAFARQG